MVLLKKNPERKIQYFRNKIRIRIEVGNIFRASKLYRHKQDIKLHNITLYGYLFNINIIHCCQFHLYIQFHYIFTHRKSSYKAQRFFQHTILTQRTYHTSEAKRFFFVFIAIRQDIERCHRN